jgi:hypothetical protein
MKKIIEIINQSKNRLWWTNVLTWSLRVLAGLVIRDMHIVDSISQAEGGNHSHKT